MVEEIGQTLYHSRAVRVFEAEGSRMYVLAQVLVLYIQYPGGMLQCAVNIVT